MSEAVQSTDFESFLAKEERSECRHEFVGGRVYVMAGGTERHDVTSQLLYELLTPGARAAGCRPFIGNRIVRTPLGSSYYPDVMVVCGRAPDPLYEVSPTLVIEVLSPSTANVDRREKATAYAAISELTVLLLVDPDVRRVEGARTVGGRIGSWDTYGPGHVVFTPYGHIDVDALHDQIDALATT